MSSSTTAVTMSGDEKATKAIIRYSIKFNYTYITGTLSPEGIISGTNTVYELAAVNSGSLSLVVIERVLDNLAFES